MALWVKARRDDAGAGLRSDGGVCDLPGGARGGGSVSALTPEQRALLPERWRKLAALLDETTPGDWYTVGPPWGDGALVNAGSPDPHRGTLVPDFSIVEDWPRDEEPRAVEDATFTCAAHNAMPALLAALSDMAGALDEWLAHVERFHGPDGYSGRRCEWCDENEDRARAALAKLREGG